MKVYVDAREVQTRIPEALSEAGVEVSLCNLEVGDYVLDDETVVLRRSALEWVEGVLDERIYNQASKARIEFAKVVILIEGDIYSTGVAIRAESLESALSHLSVVLGCSVIHYKGANRAAGIIHRMAKHLQTGKCGETVFRRGKVAPGVGHALYAIEGFSSVGPVTSRRLLSHFGSVLAVVNATPEQLCQVSGIGPTKAQRLHQSLRWDLNEEGAAVEDGMSLFSEPASAAALVWR